MEINLFVNDNMRDSCIVNFCMKLKQFNFVYHELPDIKFLYNQNNFFILKEQFSENYLKTKLKQHHSSSLSNTCFFLPKKCDINNLNFSSKIIHYPINFSDFETHLQRFFKFSKNVFMNLELKNDNVLLNNNNDKKTYSTEIESKIILLFFENEFVDKKTLNTIVLNQSPLIDSKSVESHLYRLRKKLYYVDTKKKIVLIKNKGLKII